MNRIELAIVDVVRVEFEADKPARQELIDGEPVKDTRPARQTIEVEIGSRLLRFLVEDIERPVQVVDEEPLSASAGLLAKEIDARQQTRAIAGPVDGSRHRHGCVVFDLDRQLG